MFPFLSDDVAIDRVVDATAAGSTDVNGGSVDMQGYDGVMFVALFGALTATQVTSLKAQQSADDSTFADLEGSAAGPLADADGNKLLVLDVYRPEDRYVRPVVDRGTANAVIDGVIAVRYHARSRPVTQGADVVETVQLSTPDEGTA